MSASAFVGRVGGLAAALGVGAVVGGFGLGVAAASPTDSAAGVDSAGSVSSDSGTGERSRATRSTQGPAAKSAAPSDRVRSGAARAAAESVSVPSAAAQFDPAVAPSPAAVTATAPSLARAAAAKVRMPMPVVATQFAPIAEAANVAAAIAEPAEALVVDVEPVTVTSAQPVAASGAVESAVSSTPGSDPSGPAALPLAWSVLAATRRERGINPAVHTTPAVAVSNDDFVNTDLVPAAAATAVAAGNSPQAVAPAAAEVAVDPITAIIQQVQAVITQIVGVINQVVTQVVTLVNQVVTAIVSIFVPASPVNTAPTATTPNVGSPDPVTGVVAGTVSATDSNGDALTYTAPATTAKGSVAIDASTGSFTYAPTVVARENAAKAGATAADKADTFTVTVTDGYGGTTAIAVNVVVSPTLQANRAPVAGTPVVGAPDPSTGVLIGTVSATDADGDALAFTGSTTTSKGSVVVAINGGFTYTPTTTARHAAAKNGAPASDTADTFTVSVSDGEGGSAAFPVRVTISPQNTTPTPAPPNVGTPNGSTGVVAGTVSATDADNDSLSYSGSTTTSKGTVIVNANGVFTYTPTTAARNEATADTTDNFTVTISDGYGGVIAVPVTVKILPPNKAPTPTVTVGVPNIATGVVLGSVTAADPDNDTVTFSATSRTSKGTLSINTSTGEFTYTPTAAARHQAASLTAIAADKADTFIVTVSDSRGGFSTAPVTVAIRPQNSNPTGVANVGTVDPSTGVITGIVTGFDADGDTLTYSGSGVTPEGRVTIDSTTGAITYTPVARVDTITAVIPGFRRPNDVVISPDGARAYVSDPGNNGVAVVDTTTRTIIATIGGLSDPMELALSPNGQRLYVVRPDRVSVINTATNTITGDIAGLFAPEGESPTPQDIAVSPDGTFAYIVNSRGGVMSVVDTATNTVVNTITGLDGRTVNVAFNKSGTRAYVSGPWLWDSTFIDTGTDTVIKSTGYGGDSIAVSPDGERVYLATWYEAIRVMDANQFTLISDIPIARGSLGNGLAVSRDGSMLYAIASNGQIHLFDTATNGFIGPAKYACSNCAPGNWLSAVGGFAVSPDGTYVYAAGAGRVSVLTKWVGQTTDTFNVTITDQYGGSATVPVTVTFLA